MEAPPEKPILTTDQAATRIQGIVRKYVAKVRIRRIARDNFIRVFDPAFKRYFWYNKLHETSTWQQPKFVPLFTEDDIEAVLFVQRVARGFVGRAKARRLANLKYTRYYDGESNRFYWMENVTKKTSYTASKWLQRQNIAMPSEDKLLLQSQLRIKELERKLAEKEAELKKTRKKRYEELEPEVIQDKVKEASNLDRSRHLDEWSINDLAAWFTQLKMEEYIPNIYSNKVDGLLFINLSDEELHDLGIVNKFHLRKLELIMRSYRLRYTKKKEKRQMHGGHRGVADDDEEDELLSEYSPSELSAIIAAEDAENDYQASDEESDDNYSIPSDEDEMDKGAEEQRLQRRMDENNIILEMVQQGDQENYPLIGDIVRVKYVAMITDTGKIIMHTKHILERPWVEFVLGIEQVVKGVDRALPLMSVGERTKMTFTPEYAYGKAGLPPLVPPDTSLTFDITLLGFRPRSLWVKPLIQDFNTNEKPYHTDLRISLGLAKKSGMSDGIANVYSTSMVLKEEDDNMSVANVNNNRVPKFR